MARLTFEKEIVDGKIDELSDIVSPRDQDKFCKRIQRDFREMDGNTHDCFEWGWRCFKAMRSLLFSAALYVESLRARRNRYLEAVYCYGLYYSLFHASFSIICMHPEIKTDQLLRVSHKRLMNLIIDKFVKSRILPKSFPEILERVRVMRELTSYFAPLGGLATSTSPEMRDIDLVFKESKKHMAYSFQLCNLLGSIYWKVKNDCSGTNKAICEAIFKSNGGKIGDRIERLVKYQPFPTMKFWSYVGELEFDETDSWTAVRKFHLFEICPQPLLYFMTLEVGTEQIHIENDKTLREFSKFIAGIW